MVQWALRAHTDITYIYIYVHTHISKLYASICSLHAISCIMCMYIYICVCNQPECWCLVVISGLGGKMGEHGGVQVGWDEMFELFVSPTRPHLAQVQCHTRKPFLFSAQPCIHATVGHLQPIFCGHVPMFQAQQVRFIIVSDILQSIVLVTPCRHWKGP